MRRTRRMPSRAPTATSAGPATAPHMVGGVVLAFSASAGKRFSSARGGPPSNTRPVWAASWWAWTTTVCSASGSPICATTLVVMPRGRKWRRNHWRPPVMSSVTAAVANAPASTAFQRPRIDPARAALAVSSPTGHQ